VRKQAAFFSEAVTARGDLIVGELEGEKRKSYQSLQVADEETLEDLAGLVTVSDVLKGLGGVLATDVEENFLTATVCRI
jgi:hypothetical protein